MIKIWGKYLSQDKWELVCWCMTMRHKPWIVHHLIRSRPVDKDVPDRHEEISDICPEGMFIM